MKPSSIKNIRLKVAAIALTFCMLLAECGYPATGDFGQVWSD